MVTEGHLHSQTKILVKRVLYNVPVMPIYFLLHQYWLNHGLIQYFSNRMEWVDLSRRDLDHRGSNWNIFDSNL